MGADLDRVGSCWPYGCRMDDPKKWTERWEGILTPGQLLILMMTQFAPQLRIAVKAGRATLAGKGDPIENVTLSPFSTAAAADYIWPSPQRKKKLAAASPNRAADMRHPLGIPDGEL